MGRKTYIPIDRFEPGAGSGVAEWVREADLDYRTLFDGVGPIDLTAEANPYTLNNGVEIFLTNDFASMDVLELNSTDGLLGDHNGDSGSNISGVGVNTEQAIALGGGPAYDRERDTLWWLTHLRVTTATGDGSDLNTQVAFRSSYTVGVEYGRNSSTDGARLVKQDPTGLPTENSAITIGTEYVDSRVILPGAPTCQVGVMTQAAYDSTPPTEPDDVSSPWTGGNLVTLESGSICTPQPDWAVFGPGFFGHVRLYWAATAAGRRIVANVTRHELYRWRVPS